MFYVYFLQKVDQFFYLPRLLARICRELPSPHSHILVLEGPSAKHINGDVQSQLTLNIVHRPEDKLQFEFLFQPCLFYNQVLEDL